VPFLAFVPVTFVPTVFNPASIVTINVSVFIASLEFTRAIFPAALTIILSDFFVLSGNFVLGKFFEFVPGVESPVILVFTVGVSIFAFIWKNNVSREITISPSITCLNNKAVHEIVIFIQNWEGIKVKNRDTVSSNSSFWSIDGVLIDVAVVTINIIILFAFILLPENAIVNDSRAAIIKWMFPSKLNLTSVSVVVTIITNWCRWLIE